MIGSLLTGASPEQRTGWLIVAVGVGLLLWVAWDHAGGETRVGDGRLGTQEVVCRYADPVRFRRTLILNTFAGLVAILTGAILVVWG